MSQITIEAHDEAATEALGRALAEILPAGVTVALNGPLGAGKTRLVQAIAAAVGVEPGVALSPTFVLLQEYRGSRTIFHADAYRLRDEDEFWALGADEFLNSDALVFIEWAERVAGCLPSEHLRIDIEETAPSARRFTIVAVGSKYAAVIDRLAATHRGQRQ